MTRPSLRCLLLDGRPDVVPALRTLVESVGIHLIGDTDTFAAGVVMALREQPDVVILELALTGLSGLPALHALRGAAAGCAVVVLSPFTSLAGPAQEAGALALCDDRDLAGLARVLTGLRVAADQLVSVTGNVSVNPASYTSSPPIARA